MAVGFAELANGDERWGGHYGRLAERHGAKGVDAARSEGAWERLQLGGRRPRAAPASELRAGLLVGRLPGQPL